MLAGCVPVVTDAGALPEVVGDTGVTISEPTPQAVAQGVRDALELGADAGLAARERIRTHFPYEKRRDGILQEVELALAGERS
jgi:glycosyltransferase involved in cell wall biosynthesis